MPHASFQLPIQSDTNKFNNQQKINKADQMKSLKSLTAHELATYQKAFPVFDKIQDIWKW